MAKQNINVGTTANDRKGDSLRVAFQKVNANFSELYTALGLDTAPLNLGAFEFSGSTLSTTDSTAITIDQATTITSDLTVGGDILPNVANGGNLGSAAKPWRSLYVSNSTIYLGETPLSVNGSGQLTVNGALASSTNKLAVGAKEVVLTGGVNPYVTFPAISTGENIIIQGGEIASATGAVAITSSDSVVINTNALTALNTWTFGDDGNLELPPGFITTNQVTGLNLRSGYDVHIISNHMDVDHEWILDSYGDLTLPLNGDIKAGVIEEVGTVLYDINSYDTFEAVFLELDNNLAYTWNVAQQSLLDVGADLVGWTFRGENSETLYTVIDAVVDGSSLTLTTENTIPTAPMDMLIFYSPDYQAKQAGPLNLVVDDKTLTIGTDGNITLPLNGEIRSRVVAQVGTGSSITAPGWIGATPGERKARWLTSYWANADLVAVGTDLVGWVFNPVGTTDYYTVTSAEFVDGGATLELIFAERSLPPSLENVAYTVRSPGYFERQASDITLVADEASWTFDILGGLTLPDGSFISTSGGLRLAPDSDGTLTIGTPAYEWQFNDSNGKLFLPIKDSTDTGDLELRGGGIYQIADEDLIIRARDADDDEFSVYLQVDDGAGTVFSETRLQRDKFTINIDKGGANHNWTFDNSGRATFPNGTVPEHSYGAAGDKEGMVVFTDPYIYYCKQDYVNNTTDIWVRVAWTGTNW